jgi:hypothetical protein
MHGSSSSQISSVSEHISRCWGVLAKVPRRRGRGHALPPPGAAGRRSVDPTLALRGASKGTWFGNILNERVRQRVQTAITETRSRHS